MKTTQRSLARLAVVIGIVLAGIFGTAATASAVPASGLHYGNKCLEGRQNTNSYGTEGCYFITGVSASQVYVNAGIYDGLADGYWGRTFFAVQQLNASGQVLQTYTQNVTVTAGSRYTQVAPSFLVTRLPGAAYVRMTVTAHTLLTNGAIVDSSSSVRTLNW